MGNARRIASRIVAETGGARREREIDELDRQFNRPAVVPTNRSIHQQLLAAGVELDSHESDLYAKVTPESTHIVEESGHSSSVFKSENDGQMWYDLPFAYEPFWRAKPRVADSRRPVTTDVRHPMYELGDKLGELGDAVRGDPVMTDDRVLGTLLDRMVQARAAMHRHLEEHYLWD